jgi:hypothetical protein
VRCWGGGGKWKIYLWFLFFLMDSMGDQQGKGILKGVWKGMKDYIGGKWWIGLPESMCRDGVKQVAGDNSVR